MILQRLAGSLLVAGIATFVAAAQQPASSPPPASAPALPPLPPPRGTLTVTTETADAVRKAIKAPAGFTVTAFATPPVVNYPTCITATHDGVVFVCVDRNGSLQADTGMGYIVRLLDNDRNGQADEYTVFATLDSPRGVVFDGETLYVSHPPFITALRDTDDDGIADERRTLVRGLGFGLDFRGADHTTNGLEMGIDGWLYIAVGDYGVVKATGTDGQEIQMRGGGNVRVRPDGTELEIYSRGTRNDYDLAIDPYLNLFARGNTNDGGGFDIRLYHFVAGATFGYPTLFRNFSDEVVPPLADYGTGSGTGMLYVHDAGLPAPYGDTLYSVDWGKNAIYRHALQPKGATFSVTQDDFIAVPRPNDLAIDGSSAMYLASWEGGQFRYAGEKVGWVARLTHEQAKPAPPVNLSAASDARLVELIGAANLVTSRAAQAALLRRGRSAERISLLERRAADGTLYGRVAAIFTLKQIAAADSTRALMTLAEDPAVRAFALRALADRRGELADAVKPIFVRALSATDPRVALEAVNGLRRMGAVDAAAAMLPLTSSKDPVIANVTINALASLSAIDAALAALKSSGAEDVAAGALRVLQQIHQPAAVSGLIAALSDAPPARQGAILQALARLYNREGVWRGTIGEWWGTRPDTTGPYYDPVAWEESARIRSVLLSALLESAATAGPRADVTRLVNDLQRNRVLPAGSAALLTALAADRHALFPDLARTLVGKVRLEVDATMGSLLDHAARADTRYLAPVVKLVVAAGPPSPSAAAILLSGAIEPRLDAEVRAAALTALASMTGPGALDRSVTAFASVVAPMLEPALEPVWTQFLATPTHAASVPTWRALVESRDQARQRLGFAVLLQLAADPPAGRGGRGRAGGGGGGRGRGGVNAEVVDRARAEARTIIDAAWAGPTAASLVWAVGRTGAVRYRDRIDAAVSSTDAATRDAATYARTRLDALAAKPAADATADRPTVGSIPYDDLLGRLTGVAGDAALGRKLFAQAGCAVCHTTASNEPEKGPFLGGIFTRYSKADVVESILRPSAKVAQGFATHVFTLADKRQLSGFVVREGQDDVVIRDLTGAETTLRKGQITSRRVSEGSVMLQGLVDSLTLQEFASLLAFLESTSAK